ncbi:helicase [Coemansia sp. RSA 2610]|nr:helicase [Coemansia sp. RSA 2610]
MGGKTKKAAPEEPKPKSGKRAAAESKGEPKAVAKGEPKAPAENPAQALFGKWTGKTPVTLLNEFVQKNAGWHRAEYLMHGSGGSSGFNCTIRLSKSDKKQPRPISVLFKPESTESTALKHATSLEARHVAATFVLHRLRSDTNLHRMLPPVHRAYWLELEQLRKANASQQWQFTADPFAAKLAREKLGVEREAKQAKRREQLARAEAGHREELLAPALRRRWDEMAEVAMSEAHRQTVEAVVRTWTSNWGIAGESDASGGPGDRRAARAALIKQGFRAAHVDEALAHAGTREQALDWLCVHVPEDDLPEQVLQRAYRAAAVVVAPDSSSPAHSQLSVQLAAKRLARAGFPTSACVAAIREQLQAAGAGGDSGDALLAAEAGAAQVLLDRLCGRAPAPVAGGADDGSVQAAIRDEVEALDAIYAGEGRVSRRGAYQVSVALRPAPARLCPHDARVEFWVAPGTAYPEQAAAVAVSSDALPAYLKLHVARRLNAQLGGDGLPVLVEAVTAAELAIEAWLADPPPLAGLLGGIQGAAADIGSDDSTDSRAPRATGRPRRGAPRSPDTARLCAAFAQLQTSPEYQRMQAARASLPAAAQSAHIVGLVSRNRCVVISGATGCGKTTQVPQFILDAALRAGTHANIVCTQPRRISAVGVAARVARERGEDVDATRAGSVVGYAVRGTSRQTRDTRLLFCTTGVLLRMLREDPKLASVTHVVCDEVHERSVDSDLLLALLRECLARNPSLRVVLMSATAQSDVFAGYFGAGVPVAEIPGRTFPVDDVFFEDFVARQSDAELQAALGVALVGRARAKLAAARSQCDSADERVAAAARDWLARHAKLQGKAGRGELNDKAGRGELQGKAGCGELAAACVLMWDERFGAASAAAQIDYGLLAAVIGRIHATAPAEQAVLVFVPGAAEIAAAMDAVRGVAKDAHVLPLHAGLAAAEQQRVFGRAPHGRRKVVVATNVAETSITIDDVVFVVDSGRVREVRMDHGARLARLVTAFCSQAAATQRRGRAGRAQRGVCYRLYTRAALSRVMPAQAAPEILRAPLEQVCLQAKALGYDDASGLLAQVLDPPDAAAVAGAERMLVAIGACSQPRGPLLALGRLLAQIPLDLRLAKALVFGSILGMLERTLRVVALMALDRPLFATAPDARDTARAVRLQCVPSARAQSDWLADLRAFERCVGGERLECVSAVAVREAKDSVKTLRRCVRDLGLDGSADVSLDGDEELRVLKAVVLAGLSPQLARVRMPRQKYHEVASGTISVDPEARELAFYAVDEAGSEPATWQAHDVRGDRRVFVHPQSTLFAEASYAAPFVAYLAQWAGAAGNKTFMRDVTVPGIYAVLLFGPAVVVDHEHKVLAIGRSGALAVRAWPRIGVLVGQLRRLLDELLRRKLADPQLDIRDHPVITTVLQLIRTDGY